MMVSDMPLLQILRHYSSQLRGFAAVIIALIHDDCFNSTCQPRTSILLTVSDPSDPALRWQQRRGGMVDFVVGQHDFDLTDFSRLLQIGSAHCLGKSFGNANRPFYKASAYTFHSLCLRAERRTDAHD